MTQSLPGNGLALTALPAPPRANPGPARLTYAPALESTPARLAAAYDHFIGGTWQPAVDGATFATINPATEDVLARVAHGGPRDVERAVAAARIGFERHWRPLRPAERAKYIYRIARAITERSRELRRRDHERWQTDQGVARLRRGASRGALLLLCGLGR